MGGHDAITMVLIDDHLALRTALKERIQLRTRFVVVGEADTGEKGIDLVGRLRPQVALVDVRLPGMSGDEVVREIRRRWPDVQVLAMSSSTGLDAVGSMLKAGAAGYLMKGDSIDDLEYRVFGAGEGPAATHHPYPRPRRPS